MSRREDPLRSEGRDGNREIEPGAALFHPRGREVYGNFFLPNRMARVGARTLDALAGLEGRGVREPHDHESGKPPADFAFNLNNSPLEPPQAHAEHARDAHEPTALRCVTST